MHFFTSINNNYLPKARVLAKSVKQFCPESRFTLVLCDQISDDFVISDEPFDEIVTVEDLGVPVENLNLWIFMHTVVELCTAVKGQALFKFLQEGSGKVVYLDPDIAVFNNLRELEELLDLHDVVLTPHLTHPEDNVRSMILDNEICSMKHGTYNFGFFAVKNSSNGKKFAEWWRDRLVEFCYDDIPNGLFTDQRWGDLVPSLFDGVYILRDPSYNVATWNINHRSVTEVDGQYLVNDIPLKFYHFSGFDSGSQEAMLSKYGTETPTLWKLRKWYQERQNDEGQKKYGGMPSIYSNYSNGKPITKSERKILRDRMDVFKKFKNSNPFTADENMNKSFYHWFKTEEPQNIESSVSSSAAEAELYAIYNSTSWKLTKGIRKIFDFVKLIRSRLIRLARSFRR